MNVATEIRLPQKSTNSAPVSATIFMFPRPGLAVAEVGPATAFQRRVKKERPELGFKLAE